MTLCRWCGEWRESGRRCAWSPDYVHEDVADEAAWARAVAYSLTANVPAHRLAPFPATWADEGVVVPLRAKGA